MRSECVNVLWSRKLVVVGSADVDLFGSAGLELHTLKGKGFPNSGFRDFKNSHIPRCGLDLDGERRVWALDGRGCNGCCSR